MTGRVALYAAPGLGSSDPAAKRLLERAESWLGRSVDGREVDPALPPGWTRPAVDQITVNARRYGFHGTLKAPFRLAAGRSLTELSAAVDQFASAIAPVRIPALRLRWLGDFLALVPTTRSAPLHQLADALVTEFDPYRAPATSAETTRRLAGGATPRQRELLDRWGYPYVLEEFRFHLTLTDRLPTDRQPGVDRALAGWFDGVLGRPVDLDSIAVFTQHRDDAPFTLASIHRLDGRPAAPTPTRPTRAQLGAR